MADFNPEAFEDRMVAWLNMIEGDFVIPVEAARFVEQARKTFPQDLRAYLDARAEHVVTEVMGTRLRSQRATALRRRDSRVFSEYMEAVEAGEATIGDVRSMLTIAYVIDSAGTERQLGEMHHDDFEYPAASYERTSNTAAMEAAWLRAIQKRLPANGSKSVSDKFSDEQLRSLRSRMTGNDA